MADLIVIPKFKFNAAPAKIDFNYEEVNAALVKYLEKYQSAVVTTETLADDKKLVSELNAEAKNINDLRIAQKKKLSEPISEFEEKMKALHGKYKEVSSDINEQVKAHEQVRLDKCEQMIDNLLTKTRTEREVDAKHMLDMEQNLVRLGSLTAKDALAKSARDAIANHVGKEVAFMQQTEKRLLMLENASLRAGLDAPLTRANVESFLYADDAAYDSGLNSLIQSELQRQEISRKANEERIKREQEAQVESQKRAEAEPHNRQSSEQRSHEEIKTHYSGQPVIGAQVPDMGHVFTPPEVVHAQPQQQTQTNPDGTTTRTVVATFEVTTQAHITNEQIINRLGEVMSKAGITTLQRIEVI